MARKPEAGPSADPELLILMSLAEMSRHGYAIMQDIEEFSGIKLGPGTLYTAITRLVEKGMIRPEPALARQRPYKLTKAGLSALKLELERMRTIVTVGSRRLSFT